MRRMDLLNAAVIGVLCLSADTGAAGGTATGGAADNAANTGAGAAAAKAAKERNTITKYGDLAALKAVNAAKGYKRYEVKDPAGGLSYVTARDANAAAGFVAQASNWTVNNIDATTGGPGRKPTVAGVETSIEKLSPEDRAALFERYGIKPANVAASAATDAAKTNAPATAGAAGKSGSAGAGGSAGAAPQKKK